MRRFVAVLMMLLVGSGEARDRSCRPSRNGARTMDCGSGPAQVEAFGDSSAGMTAECACTQPSVVTGYGDGLAAITTSRSTAAFCTKADYSLVSCPANTARVMTGGGPTLPLGLASNMTAMQNDVIQSRDLNQASWVKTTMTCAKTATSADGLANTASICTATAGNALVAQTVIVTGARAASLYIKRRTGTGTVSVSVDGLAFADITPRLSTTVFKRVVNAETTGCMFGGCIVVRGMQANFAVSVVLTVKVATSGDALDIDLAQVESGDFSTSPYPTTTVAATRAAELHSATGLPATTIRSMSYYVVSTGWTTAKYGINGSFQKDANNEFLSMWGTTYGPLGGTPFAAWVNGGVYEDMASTEIAPTMGPVAYAAANDGTTESVTVAGVTTTQVATVQPSTASTVWYIGGRPGGGGYDQVLSRLRVDPDATKCTAPANVASNAVVWLGDSISAGSVSAPIMPPSELTQIIGRTVWNKGLPADNAAGCLSRWTNRIRGKNYSTLIYACGTNDMIAGSVPAAHTAWTASQTVLDQALADGMRVFAGNILPEGAAVGYNTNVQAALNAYNSDWTTWCAANAGNPLLKCVDSFTEFKETCPDGGPDCLKVADAYSDARHLNGGCPDGGPECGSKHYAALFADAGI